MPGPGTLVSGLTASLLRSRLGVVALVLFVTEIIWLTIDLLSHRTSSPLIQIVLVVALGCITVLLFSKKTIPLTPLRVLELLIFSSAAVFVAVQDFTLVSQRAALGQSGLALSGLFKSVLHYVLLVVVYGMFVPNTWQRAALVVIPLASTPVLAAIWLGSSYPQMAQSIARTSSGEFVDVGLILGISVAIAVWGTRIVGLYRRQQVKASEMGFYELTKQIGAGGMGEVWLAKHHKLVRPAVIKLIRPEMVEEGDPIGARRTVRRFEREAQATAALRSPHTVELYDFGVTNDQIFYYVMEYLNGLDLATLVRKHGPVPPERTAHLLQQACESLAEAHDNHFIHRDVKPANIFVCHLGLSYDFIKVLDFGLVKTQTNGGLKTDDDLNTELTMKGVTTGTPAYMAPELAMGEGNVDARSDIYALGCVAYWLLTGQLVFQRESPLAMIVDHVKEVPGPPSGRTENEIPEELDRIVLKCLEKDPAKRFQTAMELADALSACVQPHDWDRARAESWWKLHYPDS